MATAAGVAPALQVVARVAIGAERGMGRHWLAVAVLSKFEFALRLLADIPQYQALAQQAAARFTTGVQAADVAAAA